MNNNSETPDFLKQEFTTILISVKWLGIWWEMWSEPYTSTMKEHLDRKEFYMFVRDKYKFDNLIKSDL
ncbi:hypothetical protein M0Q97_04565 [Candidatus Dojkabacteria bacterium]|jgi:hypothetical protein|nr:hypothetical protein [Candidatus Dojkabacteria bacterium]